VLYNLQQQREGALARVQELIEANEETLRGMSSDSPRRALIKVLLRRLRSKAEKLECGLVRELL
jgi:hypothetical protein